MASCVSISITREHNKSTRNHTTQAVCYMFHLAREEQTWPSKSNCCTYRW